MPRIAKVKVGEVLGEANSIFRRGEVAFQRSDHEAAQRAFDEALPLYRQIGNVVGEVNCIFGRGLVALRRSDYDTAQRAVDEALRLCREVGNVVGESNCVFGRGLVALRRSDDEAAQRAFDEALRLYREIGNVLGEANCMKMLASLKEESKDTSKDATIFPFPITFPNVGKLPPIDKRNTSHYNKRMMLKLGEENNRPAHRVGKQNVAAHFDGETVAALHDLMAREKQAKRRRVTVEGMVARGLQLVFEERGEEVPPELVHKAERPIQIRVVRKSRKLGL